MLIRKELLCKDTFEKEEDALAHPREQQVQMPGIQKTFSESE